MSKPCTYRCSVKGLILDEAGSKFLIVRDAGDFWDLPGGGIEHGADPRDELAREIMEEAHLTVLRCAMSPKYFMTGRKTLDPSVNIANVVYQCELGDFDFVETDECKEIRFVSPSEVHNLNASDTLRYVADHFNHESEFHISAG